MNDLMEIDLPHPLQSERVDVKKVAIIYGCSPSTIWRWHKLGLIPRSRKIGGTTTWSTREVLKHARS